MLYMSISGFFANFGGTGDTPPPEGVDCLIRILTQLLGNSDRVRHTTTFHIFRVSRS